MDSIEVTIKKETATRFLVLGNNIGQIRKLADVWAVDDFLYFKKPDGDIFKAHFKETSVYNLGAEEPTTFNSMAECLDFLESIGFVNFNTAEATASPYQELIFTAVQTAPQTGITSGSLIDGGRYMITNTDITADFVISGAADIKTGTIFIANATPPDWGVSGELSFEGNPIVTILNNPLSDTYTSHYTSPGCYYLEGLLDFPVDTFPKLGAVDDYVDNVVRSQMDGPGLLSKSYLWHKDNFNNKRILIKTMTGGGYDLEDDQLNGTQLFIVKIFNL